MALRLPLLVRPALLLFAVVLLPYAALGQPGWQQEVAYEMDVTLQADRHRMDGFQRLTYTNNSPDTLRTVFYHLYFNAFHPQSMMAERNRHLPDPDGRVVPRIFNLGPEEIGYHRIETLTQDGEPVSFEVNDTILRVDLAEPILPGASTVFEMRFRSQVPLQTRRSGRDSREGIDYSMSQWYPKMAAYDERGWHADPYVGREFYAPFGSFDVEITLPAAYTVGATGVLQNPEEVGHGYDPNGPATYRPGDESYAPTDSLTWHFVAERVHDFAWAADPDYIHERFTDAMGVAYHLLYQPGVEAGWEPMSEWVPALVQFFSREYGPYAYPQFTVAQAGDGGMEYPMVNFLTGRRSPLSLLGVTAHEAAHEWFYAVLASNEADYAWMDEGFTSYATEEAVARILGRAPDHTGAYLSVLNLRRLGLLERFSTPADWFTTNAAYGTASYSGGEMIVDMLGYVIGDQQRNRWLEAYYERFQFDHPDPHDLEKIAEDVSGIRLDWYFEQFTNTTRAMDYALTDLDAEPSGDGYTATLTLERKGEIVMPADVRLTLEDGSEQWITIPLVIMQGHKPVPDDWVVAEPWPWTFPTYTVTVDLPSRPVAAALDPMGKTPDNNRLNNTAGFPLETVFLQPPGQSWFDYRLGWRPLAWYAHDFGVGAGLQARGQYLFGRHRLKATLKLWPQVLSSGGEEPKLGGHAEEPDVSWFDGIDYELAYATNVDAFGERAEATLSAEKHLGFLENTLALSKPLSGVLSDHDARFTAALVHQLNPTDRVFGASKRTFGAPVGCMVFPCPDPIVVTERLNPFLREHMLSARFDLEVAGGGDRLAVALELGGSLKQVLEGPVGSNDRAQSANRFSVEAAKTAELGPLTGRAAFLFGLGDENLALHKRFRLGAASFEERWRSDAFRSAAAIFEDPLGDAHLGAFGPPGPVAYLLADPFPGGPPIGRNVVAGRLALATGPLATNPWLRPLRLEAFSGIGQTWSEGAFLAGFDAGNLLADAGIGLRYDVAALGVLDRWTAQSDVLQGLQLVAKFPVWASDPELIDADEDPVAFRWLIGISTSP